MKSTVAFALILAATTALAEPVANVRTELLVVRVPQAAALRLRPELRERKTVAAGVAELLAMIASDEAELIGAPVVWALDGTRGYSECIEEIRYPTEYDPPQWPSLFGAKTPKTPEQIVETLLFQFMTVPTAFETRNAGLVLELETTVEPDRTTILMNVVPQHVSYEGMGFVSEASRERDDWRFQQPKFRFLRITTSLTVRSGEWQLINASVVRGPAPAMEFFLMRATVLPVRP